MLLESGNDCAEAIAEHVAGSIEEFAKLMNEKAKELGATNTSFKNPSGLTEDGHLTTAHDLALIMRYASQNPDFVRISQTPSYFYENHPYSNGNEKWASNHNPLLKENSAYTYKYAYTGKTGYTVAANHSYAAVAVKDDQEIVGAFLNATDKDGLYTGVGQLFDWGFENFKTEKIVTTGDKLDDYQIDDSTTIPLLAADDVYYTFNLANGENIDNINYSLHTSYRTIRRMRNQKSRRRKSRTANQTDNINLSVTYENKDLSKTSIKKGETLFNASLLINGNKICDIKLDSGESRKYTAEVAVKNTVNSITNNKYFIPGVITGIILIIIIIIIILSIRKRKRRKRFLARRSYIRNKHNF